MRAMTMLASDIHLRITETFFSLQGESSKVGLPTVFVRLTGCPLRCVYCDTSYAFQGGEMISLTALMQRVADYGAQHVCVTGGEPLAQKACWPLLSALCEAGYSVSLETSGAIAIDDIDPRVQCVMDLKTPSSGELDKNLYDNIDKLNASDEVKFVIADRADYDWACAQIREHALDTRLGNVLMSPSHGVLSADTLAQWILDDGLRVRFQTQLHKVIWGEKPGC